MVSDLKFGPSSCKDSTYPASPSSVSNSWFFFLLLFLLSPRHSQGRRNVSNFEGASYERTAYDRFVPLFLVRQNLGGSIEPWGPTPLPSSKYLARIFFRLSFFSSAYYRIHLNNYYYAYTITDGSTEGNSNICNIENQVGAVGFINVLFPEFIIDKL